MNYTAGNVSYTKPSGLSASVRVGSSGSAFAQVVQAVAPKKEAALPNNAVVDKESKFTSV